LLLKNKKEFHFNLKGFANFVNPFFWDTFHINFCPNTNEIFFKKKLIL